MSSSSDSDSLTVQSESSTIVYGHESFEQFQSKALAFAQSSVWPHADPNDKITVERLCGGGFNRVIGLALISSSGKEHNAIENQRTKTWAPDKVAEYILRIPRFHYSRVDDDVAALLFVKRLPAAEHMIPVPEVITFDETENNRLQSPFMVQNRLKGQPVLQIYSQLEHGQQRRVAQELGLAFRRMLAVSSTQAGRLVLPDHNKALDAQIHVTSWDPHVSFFRALPRKPRTTTPYRTGRASESVVELLKRTFQEQKAEFREMLPSDTLRPSLMDKWCNMASEMDAAGYFEEVDGHFALSHLDLWPRNILVDQESPSDRPIISSILDWDDAVLAPAFMSCTPPMWIWCWQYGDDEDERLANEEPATSEQRELKKVFEAAAGPLYVKLAYPPAYRLARRLVRFAIDGMRSNGSWEESEDMLDEWRSLVQKDTLRGVNCVVS